MVKPYYNHKGITIYCGDCLEVIPELELVDLMVTDPPYIIDAGRNNKIGGCFGDRKHFHNTQDFTDGGCDYNFLNKFQNWFCCCSLKQLPLLLEQAEGKNHVLITWCKTNPVPTCNNKYLPDSEYIIHSWSKGRLFGDMSLKSTFSVMPQRRKETTHPNEKPLKLISKLIQLGSLLGETILDPFMGSGTTLVAAKELGRKATGIEIEEKWCEVAARRLQQEVMFGI